MKPAHMLIASCLVASTLNAYAQDPDLARNLAATCANCHGTNGHSLGDAKRLAGEPKEKLLRKLSEYVSGEKPATIMNQIAKGYTQEQLDMITEYFSAQK